MKKILRNATAFGLLISMSFMMASCSKEAEKKEEETQKVENIGKKYIEGAKTPSTSFGSEERAIWYYIKDKTKDDVIQSVDDDAIIDSVYVLENGQVTIYELDYETFALDNKLGDLEQMSDDAIIELLISERQSKPLQYDAIIEEELAIGQAVEESKIMDTEVVVEEDGEIERHVIYSGISGPYEKYIYALRKFDISLYEDCKYQLSAKTSEDLSYIDRETVSFYYTKAMTIPEFLGTSIELDENGNVVITGEGLWGALDGKYIAAEPATGREFSFVKSKGVTEVGLSYYGGFVVENVANYGVSVENGWFVTRTDKNTKFSLDSVETEGIDIDGL